MGDTSVQVERRARRSTLLEWSVRAGLVGYGAVHLLLAWVALALVAGHDPGQGSASATGQGALAQLADDALGRVLLTALAFLFAALAVWQLIAAAVGYRDDDGLKRLAMRLGAGCRVVAYGYFAVASAKFAAQGTNASRRSPESTTERVLNAPAGAALLVAVGVVMVAIGIGLAGFGVAKGFVDQLDSTARNADRRVPIVVLGQVGYVVKGLAFVVIGVLLGIIAVTRDADKAGGLDQSLYEVLGHSAGSIAVVVVGLGIGCFGLYLFARSWHLNEDTLTS
ncbi:MAG: DUF1206 domain-containing protein [Nocardioidaceae bacterium]|nr:DUF1206 domain-containing protein [Nocardioidaceae bacterium]NUS49439.1 DUF1206 domain-containing protein [Nocardioidaceae bacterium]